MKKDKIQDEKIGENFETEQIEDTKENTNETELTEQEADAAEDDAELLKVAVQNLKNDYLRALAEAENTKKRCAQEIEKNTKYAIASFAKNLLSVADNLHRAIESAGASPESCKDLLKGVELTENELMKVFAKHGISKMDIMGKTFDPNFHQVIQEVEDKEKPNGTIIAELQTGYMINDRILREAMVVVTKSGK